MSVSEITPAILLRNSEAMENALEKVELACDEIENVLPDIFDELKWIGELIRAEIAYCKTETESSAAVL